MCMENINLQYSNNFDQFGQNIAEFYDNRILLTIRWGGGGNVLKTFPFDGKTEKVQEGFSMRM